MGPLSKKGRKETPCSSWKAMGPFKEGGGRLCADLHNGKVNILVEGNHVFAAMPGNLFGEDSIVLCGK
jgi:hypothetical protein